MEKDLQFKSAIEANRDRIYRICSCYVKDNDERNDVYQEVLIHIWESLGKFEGKSQISTWIYKVTVNTCLGYLRSEKRRNGIFAGGPQVDQTNIPDQVSTEEGNRMEQEIQELYRCINQRGQLEKTLVSLYLEDVSTKDMADIVGISEANVRVKLHRIKKTLKEKLEDKDHGS
jgi:RNA polymerase sigma-70 factor (ECF subfamily)